MSPHVLRRVSLFVPLALAMLTGCQDTTTTAPLTSPTPHFAQGDGGLWTVNTLLDPGDGVCDDTECTLREAIAAAGAGDRVIFASGLTGNVILAAARLVIFRNLTIDGEGRIAVDAQRGSGVLLIGTLDAANQTPAVTLRRLTLKNGWEGQSYGGGIDIGRATVTLDSVALLNNEATTEGGGIRIKDGSLTIRNSTIAGNKAGSDGGGIYVVSGEVSVTASTLSANDAAGSGGAIYNDNGLVNLYRSTVSTNRANFAGAFYNLAGLGLVSTTVTHNTAAGIGGYVNNASMSVQNSIVAGNVAGNCAGAFSVTPLGRNITGTDCPVTGGIAVAPADVFTTVIEGDLKDNGGATKTHAAIARGRAVDSGSCASETADQRGARRPFDDPGVTNWADGCDIGAYEVQGADLMVSQGVDRTSAKQGDVLTYTVRVQSFGPETAPNVVLTDVLSSGVTFVGASANKGTITAPPRGETGTVTWNLGTVTSNANEVVTIKVTVLVKGKTTVTNTASVAGGIADPNAANNSASITVSVASGSGAPGGGGKKP